MLKNYFKVAFRSLLRNKGYAFINIAGLSIGMASAVLILLWVQNETGFDRFHKNEATLYEAWNRGVFDNKLQCWSTTPKILGPTLKQEYPEIANTARVNWGNNLLFTIGDKRLMVSGTCTDPAFLSMFSFPLVSGNPNTVLNDVYSMVITEKLAHKLFGSQDPMGKLIRVDDHDNFTVKGVMKDLPNNTSFDFEYLLPWTYMEKRGWSDSNWDNNSTSTYIQLNPNSTESAVDARIKNITIRHLDGKEQIEVFLHPIMKWHLYSDFENGKIVGGRIETVRMFTIIAVFILLIACINFMNLSTARSEKRAKEVGIRKVIGARKGALIGQFLGESILLSFLSGLLALAIVQLSLHAFNRLTDKVLYIGYDNPNFWLSAIGFTLFTGLLAGSYPAFYLSAFQPVKVLKGTVKAARSRINPRKILVVFQFTFAITLIICTIIVRNQQQYAQDRKTGYTRNNLVYHFLTGDLEKNYSLVKNELLSSGAAISVSKTSAPLTEGWSNSWGFEWPGKDPNDKTIFNRYCTDEDIVKTAGFRLLQGRDLNLRSFPTDSTAIILNESAVRAMNLKNPVGQTIRDDGISWHVVGVIEDFVLRSPFQTLEPMVIEGSKGWFSVIHFRLNGDRSNLRNLQGAEQIFKKYNPRFPFEYHFIDEEYAKKFDDTRRTATLTGLFAGLTIFISCLGLFGLAAFMAGNRIKEIGVRKVLGASVANITALLSKEFLWLMAISILIASPVAWYAMHQWLAGYAYRINIQWWVFATTALLSLLIALATVSYQAIRAAIANPIRSLRTE
jgi:putative ABC transport system permease protein